MTGPEHYREAERLLALDADAAYMNDLMATAQVHATLALAAATALPAVWRYQHGYVGGDREWMEATA